MEIKKSKSTKSFVAKSKLKFEDYKHSLEAIQLKGSVFKLALSHFHLEVYLLVVQHLCLPESV